MAEITVKMPLKIVIGNRRRFCTICLRREAISIVSVMWSVSELVSPQWSLSGQLFPPISHGSAFVYVRRLQTD